MQKFYKLVEMAMDFQGKPDVWNPNIKREIESGQEEILGTLPSQEYLDTIHSEEYIDLINRITRLTGIREDEINTHRVPSIIGRAGAAFNRIHQIERAHTEEIKRLALDTVLGLEEFAEIKELYEQGKIKFDIQQGHGDMQREEPNVEEELDQEAEEQANQLENEEETTEMEQDEFDLYQELVDNTEKKLRRRLMNALMQGNAVNKFQLYHLVVDQLNRINPELVNLYGISTTLPQLAYHQAPDFMFPGQEENEGGEDIEGQGAIGSEAVSFDEEGVPVIKVRALTFPLLCHELTKGIYELMAYHPEETDLGVHNPKVERKDTLHGVPLWKKFQAAIPLDKQKLTPSIYQRFTRIMDDENETGLDKIKAVFAGGERGRRVMDSIIAEIEAEQAKHREKLAQWEAEQEGGNDYEEEEDEDRGF